MAGGHLSSGDIWRGPFEGGPRFTVTIRESDDDTVWLAYPEVPEAEQVPEQEPLDPDEIY